MLTLRQCCNKEYIVSRAISIVFYKYKYLAVDEHCMSFHKSNLKELISFKAILGHNHAWLQRFNYGRISERIKL